MKTLDLNTVNEAVDVYKANVDNVEIGSPLQITMLVSKEVELSDEILEYNEETPTEFTHHMYRIPIHGDTRNGTVFIIQGNGTFRDNIMMFHRYTDTDEILFKFKHYPYSTVLPHTDEKVEPPKII